MRLKSYITVTKATFSAWMDDNAPRLGAALAFYSVLSFGPLLLLVLAAAGAVFGQEAAQGRIAHEMTGLLGSDGARTVQDIIANAGAQKTQGVLATIFGLATLLLGASGVFGELQEALNTIWKATPPQHASNWRAIGSYIAQRFLSFSMVMGCAFLLLISLAISTGIAALGDALGGVVADRLGGIWGPEFEYMLRVANLVLSFGIVTVIFALMFKILPDVQIAWRDVWHGALLTSFLFSIGKGAIGLYLGHSGIASGYGAAGSIIMLLLWIYYSAQILFFGAEFTKIYAQTYGSHQKRGDVI